MAIWNDRDTALAYLITFRTYGTWLHGDERGSIDRYHNQYLAPKVEPNRHLEEQHRSKLKGQPVRLNGQQRELVRNTIQEVCGFRQWKLWAANVRTNHAHSVVSSGLHSPDKVLNDFKAYSTRRMRESGVWSFDHSPWVNKGSKRNLWTDDHIYHACNFVNNAQGDDLLDFL